MTLHAFKFIRCFHKNEWNAKSRQVICKGKVSQFLMLMKDLALSKEKNTVFEWIYSKGESGKFFCYA